MKLQEVQSRWDTMFPLRYHFSNIEDKQINYLFTATEDPILAEHVYFVKRNGAGFPFSENEKRNQFVWVVYVDHSLQLLSEVLRDEELLKILDQKGIPPRLLLVEDAWSEYVKWYRGFGLEMSYTSQPLSYEINDEATGEKYEETIPETWRDSIYIPYWNSCRGIEKMKKPRIRFKAPKYQTAEVSLIFDVRN